MSSPDPRTTGYNELDGVSCPSASFCIAAGWYGNGTTAQDLALRWNGTRWAKVSSPDPGDTSELDGVSCPSTSFCMAAGWYDNGTAGQILMLKWNGTRWAKVSSPEPGTGTGQDNDLDRVSCPSTRFCMADGYHYNGTVDQTLAEQW